MIFHERRPFLSRSSLSSGETRNSRDGRWSASASREKAADCPPAANTGSGWLSGLVSGAADIISSFLDSDSGSSYLSSGSSHSINEVSDGVDDKHDEVSSKHLVEVLQIVKESEALRDLNGRSLVIISEIKVKDAIKQLLMQESFSRSEYNRLVNIIQSRVTEYPSVEVDEGRVEEELLSKSIGIARTYNRILDPLNKNEKPTDSVSGSSAFIEARRRLEQNNSFPTSKDDLFCGPCILDSNLLHHDCKAELCSPVDIAKTYMQSLHSLPSQSWNSNGFKTTPHAWKHQCVDETESADAIHSVPSLKAPKRCYLDLVPWHSFDKYRSIRLKPMNPLNAKDKNADFSMRRLADEACKFCLQSEDRCTEVTGLVNPVCRCSDMTAEASKELNINEYFLVRPRQLHEEANEARLSLKPDDKALNTVNGSQKSADPPQLSFGKPSQLNYFTGDISQDKEPLEKIQQGNMLVPCARHSLSPVPRICDDTFLEDVSNPEEKVLSRVDLKSLPSSTGKAEFRRDSTVESSPPT
ncbi:hypothetical protein AXF42_Ash001834 [Apostasia shenzhenica]|uniref:Uncharacterized protein n=1 Tax=Apostasia shenzhenica TaxID=1088818 RepID=A0A2I0ABC6_9ASPA|nr:hypothetical protein AXF42_Ash001834 [Apostasia shenzhenica]